jgi:hypothetical protein
MRVKKDLEGRGSRGSRGSGLLFLSFLIMWLWVVVRVRACCINSSIYVNDDNVGK